MSTVTISDKTNIFGYSLSQLEDLLEAEGEKRFRGRQIFQWLYQKQAASFDEMTNLNRPLRDRLAEKYEIRLPEIAGDQVDPHDGTRKFLVRCEDGALVEMVLIPVRDRLALCMSSQVGCTIGCKFCATGLVGFKRNLTAGEMIGQFMLAQQNLGGKELANVVMMGMGEPLLNMDNLISMIGTVSSEMGLGFSARRFTISTVGLINEIRKLTEYGIKAGFALSLHAPIQQLRERLIPSAKDNPLDELIPACRDYIQQAGDRMTLEYILIEGITDTMECAKALADLTRQLPCKVNLIPYNPIIDQTGQPLAPIKVVKKGRLAALRGGKTSRKSSRPKPFEPQEFRTPSQERIDAFREYLYPRCPAVTLRTPKGRSIAAACGQLVAQVQRFEKAV